MADKRIRLTLFCAAALFFLAAILITWLLLSSQGETKAKAAFHQAGSYRVAVELDPEKPRIGDNRLVLTLQDENGTPVTGAAIKAVAEMPAMGAMPAMQAPVAISETAPGHYLGEFELVMDGAWPLTLSIETPALGHAEFKFDLTTSRAGLRLLSPAPAAGTPLSSTMPDPAEEKPGTIHVDARRRQLIGVTTAKTQRRRLIRTLRAPARVAYDETAFTDVSLKFDAWIGDLKADSIGTAVRKGQVLFTVYNPDLVSAQEEYLESLRRGRLATAARRRLAIWDVNAAQIEALEKRGRAADYLPILSPTTGTVVEKRIVAGSSVKAGQPLMRIADLSKVWIEAQVYESEVHSVRKGMKAEVVLPDIPERTFRAKVAYVYPYFQPDTRTAKLRIELPNAEGLLRPDMLATARLQIDLGERLAVPESAVIYAGTRRYVFVDLGNGRLQPRRIEIGPRTDEFIAISSGLTPGDTVVTSGNFLIAAESKLKKGMEQW